MASLVGKAVFELLSNDKTPSKVTLRRFADQMTNAGRETEETDPEDGMHWSTGAGYLTLTCWN